MSTSNSEFEEIVSQTSVRLLLSRRGTSSRSITQRLLFTYGTAGLTGKSTISRFYVLPYSSPRIRAVVLALVAYEYLTTFDQEVTTVWKRKLTATSALLLVTRWTMIINQILAYLPTTSQASLVCDI